MKVIKVLQEWPLSKVELVEVKGKKYILKTIHKDFAKEPLKQELLRKKCKDIKIPKVFWVKKGKRYIFLMDYIEENKKISKKEANNVIRMFHDETKKVNDKLFSIYDFEAFYNEYSRAKKNLIGFKKNKESLNNFFREIFESEKSIVHSDFDIKNVILSGKDYYLIDFCRSFYGPSILDFSIIYKPKNKLEIKAKLARLIRDIAWFELCKEKYINYDYKKEIAKKREEFFALLEKIK